VAARLQQTAMEEQGDVNQLAVLSRVLLTAEEREIQRERAAVAREKLALNRERFEFNASAAALKILPMLDQFNAQDEARETARVEDIKRCLFGREMEEWNQIQLAKSLAASQHATAAAAATAPPTCEATATPPAAAPPPNVLNFPVAEPPANANANASESEGDDEITPQAEFDPWLDSPNPRASA
jgi:hypothetical protein